MTTPKCTIPNASYAIRKNNINMKIGITLKNATFKDTIRNIRTTSMNYNIS